MHFNCRGGTQRRKKSSVRPSFYMEQVGDSFVLFPLLKSISFLVLDMPQGTLTSSKKHSVKGSYLLLNRSHVFSKSALLSKSQKWLGYHAANERRSKAPLLCHLSRSRARALCAASLNFTTHRRVKYISLH